jgi:hypothetical protein
MLKPLALRPQDFLGAIAQLFATVAPKRSPRRKICDFPRSKMLFGLHYVRFFRNLGAGCAD